MLRLVAAPSSGRRCQWIEGDPSLRRFCDRPSIKGENGQGEWSWCAEHRPRVYISHGTLVEQAIAHRRQQQAA